MFTVVDKKIFAILLNYFCLTGPMKFHISVSSCSSFSSLFLSEELELDVELDFLKYLECSELLLERLDPLSSST